MLNTIIFSKDRACQLELLLRSIKIFFTGWEQCTPVVLYTYSNSFYAEGYDRLKLLHPEFVYACENDSSDSFKLQTLRLVDQMNPYTVFFVDDNIFRQFFSVDDREFRQFTDKEEILCLSLRLSPQINYTYSTNQVALPPRFEDHLIWNWRDALPSTDWSYPMSLDGHIFRTCEIYPLVAVAEFRTPNFLEESLALAPIDLPRMSCYPEGRIVNIPANRVQEAFPNRHGNLMAPGTLNQAFLKGNFLTFSNTLEIENTSVHQEYPIELRTYSNKHLTPRVSVVVLCHNHAEALPGFIEKLLIQSLQAFEIVIVDNGSTDESKEVAERLMKVYPNFQIQIISQELSQSREAQTKGEAIACGEVRICLSPDQPVFSTLLEEYLELVEQTGGDEDFIARSGLFKRFCQSQAELERSQAQLKIQLEQKQQGLERALIALQDVQTTNKELWSSAEEQEKYVQQLLAFAGERERCVQELQHQQEVKDSQLQAMQAELKATVSHLEEAQEQLSETQEQLSKAEACVERAYDQLKEVYAQLENAHVQIESKHRDTIYVQTILHEARGRIAAIESSKFWKLRTKWVQFKHKLGLAKEDLALSASSTTPAPEVTNSEATDHPVIGSTAALTPQVVEFLQEDWDRDRPLVSVIIPCFNYGQYLEEAIDSVLSQTFQNFEIIVVDDGSNEPRTLQVLDMLDKPKTTLIRQANKKLPAARNAGIQISQGKYVCCLDADDLIKPTYLEKCLARLESKNLDVCYSWIEEFGDSSEIHRMGEFDIETLVRHNCAPVSSVFKREIWEQVGGYDETMVNGYEDWNFWIAIAKIGGLGGKVDEPLFLYRKHGRTMIDAALDQHEILCKQVQANHGELFSNPQLVQKVKSERRIYSVERPFLNLLRGSIPASISQGKVGRVLFALPWLVTGGAETVILHLAKTLKSEDFSLTICTTEFPPSKSGDCTSKFEQVTKEIYHLPRLLDKEQWKEFTFYLIESRSIDLILLAGSTYFYELLPDLKKRFPTIRIIDQLYNEFGHIENNRKYAKYINLNIVENEGILACLLEKYGEQESKVCLIHNGVDTEYFSPESLPSFTQNSFSLPKNKFVITFMGRFSSEKGPDLFLEIVQQLRDDTRIHFIMAGDGPLREQVLNLVEQYQLSGCVELPGFIDPRECLRASNLLVVPSRNDGRPNSILESLSMGVPVIAAAVGGIPKIIINGYNGYVVDSENVQSFVGSIRQVVCNSSFYVEMRENARKYALSEINIAEFQRKYIGIFKKVLAQQAGNND